jgi:hypothetical protein
MGIRNTLTKQLPPFHRIIRVTVALLALTGLSNPARANLVANGSFEIATATTTSQFLGAGVSNWLNSDIGETLALPSWYTNGYLFPGVGLAGPFPQTSPDGGYFVLSDGDYRNSAIYQTITGLFPGTSYQLTFYQALAQDTELYITIPGPVSGKWQVTIGSTTQYSSMMYADGSTPTISPWASQSMTFTAQNASEILSFFSIGTGDPPLVGLDGISLVATSPEPEAIWLVGLGSLLVGWRLRALRKTAVAAK